MMTMDVHIESSVETSDGTWTTRFGSPRGRLWVKYMNQETHWMMRMDSNHFCVEDIPLIEAAVHELKRLNGTLPPVRGGGMRPAKGGE